MFKVISQVLPVLARTGLRKIASGMEKQDLDNYPPFKNNYSFSMFNKLYLGDAIESVKPNLISSLGISCSLVLDKLSIRRTKPNIGNSLEVASAVKRPYFGWHQDSNPIYKEKPMFVMWIPLEDDCGVNRPSISILKSKAANQSYNTKLNSWRFDGSRNSTSDNDILNYYHTNSHDLHDVKCNLGDIVIFDGLTFHKSSSSPGMVLSRSAIVARFIPTEFENCGYGLAYKRLILDA